MRRCRRRPRPRPSAPPSAAQRPAPRPARHAVPDGRRLTAPLPLTPPALADRLAALLAAVPPEPGAAALRVAVDGPDAGAVPDARWPPPWPTGCPRSAGRRSSSRPTGFYRPASLRLEHGRTDPDARYTDWLDAGALAREVLDPVGPGGAGRATCRRCGTSSATARPGRGPGRCRPAGCCSCPARCCRASGWRSTSSSTCGSARRPAGGWTPAEQAWELPAFDRYDDEVDPPALADAVVLADHPDRPALVAAAAPLQLNSPATQRSMMCRAIDTGGGSARGPVARAQLVAGEPAGLLDLVVVEPQLARVRRRGRRSRASATAGTATAGWRRSGRR